MTAAKQRYPLRADGPTVGRNEQKLGKKKQAPLFPDGITMTSSLDRTSATQGAYGSPRSVMRPNAARSRSHPPMERSGRHDGRPPEASSTLHRRA